MAAEVATLGRRLAVLAKQKALLCVEECLLRALSVLNRDGPIRHHPVRAEFIEAQALERRALRRPAGSPLGGHAQGERTSDKARAVTATQGRSALQTLVITSIVCRRVATFNKDRFS